MDMPDAFLSSTNNTLKIRRVRSSGLGLISLGILSCTWHAF